MSVRSTEFDGAARRKPSIGVVGAGVMGCGVSAELARAGFDVILVDIARCAREAAPPAIRLALRTRAMLRGDANPEPLVDVLSRVSISSRIEELTDCSVIIENIVEDVPQKEALYRQMGAVLAEGATIIVNSSTVEICRVGQWLGRPEAVVGVHFMNPVSAIDTVEMIVTEAASPETVAAVEELLATIGKRPLKIRDACGYVSNRIYMLTVNEAVRTLQDGVASAETIDQIFQQCFGWRTGPLATADLIGLDTICLSLNALRKGFGDPKFAPADLLLGMVEQGKLGCKTGGGFFEYD